jgi:hypothetical protein
MNLSPRALAFGLFASSLLIGGISAAPCYWQNYSCDPAGCPTTTTQCPKHGTDLGRPEHLCGYTKLADTTTTVPCKVWTGVSALSCEGPHAGRTRIDGCQNSSGTGCCWSPAPPTNHPTETRTVYVAYGDRCGTCPGSGGYGQ